MKGFIEAARASDLILLSRARILRVALAIADRDGPSALTIRRLAAAVRQPPMNMYFWFRSKGDLVDQMVDAVFTRVPEELEQLRGPWKRQVRAAFTILRSALRAHPGAIAFLHGRRAPGLNLTRSEELIRQIIRSDGFGDLAADRILAALTAYTVGFAFLETRARRGGAEWNDRAFRLGLDQLLPGSAGVKRAAAPLPPARRDLRSRSPSRPGGPGR
jgi:AcrR family transcriptional regulator